MRQFKHQGAKNELLAALWLIGEGYEVFRNISHHGPMDIVAIRGGEVLRLDVKQGYFGEGGKRVMTILKQEQRDAGIYALHVFPDGSCFIDYNPMARRNLTCLKCGKPYAAKKGEHLYCSPECRPSYVPRKKQRKPARHPNIGTVIDFEQAKGG